MFQANKYTKYYFQIIHKRKVKDVIKLDGSIYNESHHIIPRSLGGDNTKNNLVRLTAREHFICHYLLTKMISDKTNLLKVLYAFNMMSVKHNNKRYVNARLYEANKIKISNAHKDPIAGKEFKIKVKKGIKDSGYVRTREHQEKLNESFRNKAPVAKEVGDKISKIKTGVPLSEYHRKRIGEGLTGKVLPEEVKKKISESRLKLNYKTPKDVIEKIILKTTGQKRSSDFKENHSKINTGKRKMINELGKKTWVKQEDIENYLLNGWKFTILREGEQGYIPKKKVGGVKGFKHKQETKDKMSKAKKGKPLSEEILLAFKEKHVGSRKMFKENSFKFVKKDDLIIYLKEGWDFVNREKKNDFLYFEAGILEEKIKPSACSSNFKKMINPKTKEEKFVHKLLIEKYQKENWFLKKPTNK